MFYSFGKYFLNITTKAPTKYPWMKPKIKPMIAPKNVAAYPLYKDANKAIIGSPIPRAIANTAKLNKVMPNIAPNLIPKLCISLFAFILLLPPPDQYWQQNYSINLLKNCFFAEIFNVF